MVQEHRPQILFLCETKMMPKQMQNTARRLQFQNCFKVSRKGLGGGLVMMWTSEVTLEVKSFSNHHVDAVVHSENGSY